MKLEIEDIINSDECPLCHQKHSSSSKDIALGNLESFNNDLVDYTNDLIAKYQITPEQKQAQRDAIREEVKKELKLSPEEQQAQRDAIREEVKKELKLSPEEQQAQRDAIREEVKKELKLSPEEQQAQRDAIREEVKKELKLSPEEQQAQRDAIREEVKKELKPSIEDIQKQEAAVENKISKLLSKQDLKNKEVLAKKDLTITRLTDKIEKLKTDSHLSSELNGTVQHKAISDILQNYFTDAVIEDAKPGEPGGDIIINMNDSGTRLLIESKNVNSFQQAFIDKALADKAASKSDIVIITTKKMPATIKATGQSIDQDVPFFDDALGLVIMPWLGDSLPLICMCEAMNNHIKAKKMPIDSNFMDTHALLSELYDFLFSPEGKAIRATAIRKHSILQKNLSDAHKASEKLSKELGKCMSINTEVEHIMTAFDKKLAVMQISEDKTKLLH